jgi:transcriptional regulator
MYIPAHFKNENQQELLEFIRANPFGLLVSNGSEYPDITHLPFTLDGTTQLRLSSHFAAANPQAQLLKEGDKVTVVLSGPHAYISPSLYDAQENVPTWNYIAVHAHGIYRLCTEDEKETVLRKMIAAYEPAYEKQYDSLPEKYTAGLKKGIVAFTVEVQSLQGKYKLSQNKKPEERERITHHLAAHADTSSLADYMSKAHPTENKK